MKMNYKLLEKTSEVFSTYGNKNQSVICWLRSFLNWINKKLDKKIEDRDEKDEKLISIFEWLNDALYYSWFNWFQDVILYYFIAEKNSPYSLDDVFILNKKDANLYYFLENNINKIELTREEKQCLFDIMRLSKEIILKRWKENHIDKIDWIWSNDSLKWKQKYSIKKLFNYQKVIPWLASLLINLIPIAETISDRKEIELYYDWFITEEDKQNYLKNRKSVWINVDTYLKSKMFWDLITFVKNNYSIKNFNKFFEYIKKSHLTKLYNNSVIFWNNYWDFQNFIDELNDYWIDVEFLDIHSDKIVRWLVNSLSLKQIQKIAENDSEIESDVDDINWILDEIFKNKGERYSYEELKDIIWWFVNLVNNAKSDVFNFDYSWVTKYWKRLLDNFVKEKAKKHWRTFAWILYLIKPYTHTPLIYSIYHKISTEDMLIAFMDSIKELNWNISDQLLWLLRYLAWLYEEYNKLNWFYKEKFWRFVWFNDWKINMKLDTAFKYSMELEKFLKDYLKNNG